MTKAEVWRIRTGSVLAFQDMILIVIHLDSISKLVFFENIPSCNTLRLSKYSDIFVEAKVIAL